MYPSSPDKPTSTNTGKIVQYDAGAIMDAGDVCLSPGSIVMRGGEILAVGEAADVRRTVGRADDQVDLPDCVLVPGLVNAHVHLQMTTIGPIGYPGDFGGWVVACRDRWQEQVDRLGEQQAVRAAVSAGVEAGRAAGVMHVGDIISWNEQALGELRDSAAAGVGYVELVGIGGEKLDRAMERLKRLEGLAVEQQGIALGLEPHAPYSTGPAIYAAAAAANQRLGMRLTTHLAEMREELQFVADTDGPLRQLIDRLGRWDAGFADHYGQGETPVEWLDRCARPNADWLCAHCNYVNDSDIALLAARGWSVAYCPRASEYFGHVGHRYRDMLEAGVNVALGTDSIVCHGTLSVLDEMRRLRQRDATDVRTLLAMATTRGMAALRLDPLDAIFTIGRSPGLLALRYDASSTLDPLAGALMDRQPPTVLEAIE